MISVNIEFVDQIARIKNKLDQARVFDKDYKVFGANSHKYEVGDPVTLDEIVSFEKKYSINLPNCYRSFLLEIGNGGSSYSGSGAGPFYGIYPLGEGVDELIEQPELYIHKEPAVSPNVSEDMWSELTKRLNEDEEIPDAAYESELGKVFSGLLPIGSQGCSMLHALIVTGENAGRVVNLDIDLQTPRVCYESNFLDWYERWLDEINSGILLEDGPSWFGYTMGGDDKFLLGIFKDSIKDETRLEALNGLAKLLSISDESKDALLEISSGEYSVLVQHSATLMLAQFSYEKAIPRLEKLVDGDDQDCLVCCESIFWYAKDQSKSWVGKLAARLEKGVSNEETFRFITYILKESDTDYGHSLLPYCSHESEDIRVSSYYSIGLLKNKRKYLDQFVVGLNDESSLVVHASLQALSSVKEKSLMTPYMMILERFKTDENYVLTNLNHRLKELGFSSRADFELRFRIANRDPDKVKFGLIELMKGYLKRS